MIPTKKTLWPYSHLVPISTRTIVVLVAVASEPGVEPVADIVDNSRVLDYVDKNGENKPCRRDKRQCSPVRKGIKFARSDKFHKQILVHDIVHTWTSDPQSAVRFDVVLDLAGHPELRINQLYSTNLDWTASVAVGLVTK